MWQKYALYPLLLLFVKLVLLITFVVHFSNFLNGFEISMIFCVFLNLFWLKKKVFFKILLVIFQTWKPNSQKMAQKIKKMYQVNVS